jgi:hypothetical protein
MNSRSNTCIRLLMSARDPAGALVIKEVAKKALKSPNFEIYLVASEPAFSIFKNAHLPVHLFEANTNSTSKTLQEKCLLKKAEDLVSKVNPHSILAGHSGPDAGIDEALIACSGSRNTYVVQDYWGCVNLTLGKSASTYFVIDEDAAQFTKESTSSETVIVGSVKHALYGEMDIFSMRKEARDAIGIGSDKKMICFFGQSLEERAGYETTILNFASSVNRLYSNDVLVYRPHPKESRVQREKVTEILSKSSARFFLDDSLLVESTLAACDIAVSCCSLIGYDLLMLNRFSKTPIGVPVYLMFEPRVTSMSSSDTTCRFDDVPFNKKGITLLVRNVEDMDKVMLSAGSKKTHQEIWAKAGKFLPNPSGAEETILTKISSDLDMFGL